ncbi:MAG: DUF2911 domain-containing protein [Longimicrobiales bacterium]|nr:DUF2911 domain-containing protein [Longimicrobiales bacterium]
MNWIPSPSRVPVLLAALAACLLVPTGADAQIRASEPASLTQTIDGTVFRIDYYRPRVKGRDVLFGKEAVVWEHVWTPGANWATKLAFQRPIELEGRRIEPGVYSLWFEMDENMMPAEFFLEPDTMIFHTVGPERADDQIRFPTELEDGHPHQEVLTWDFEDYRSDGGTLALRWGTHRVAFDVKVEPSMRMTVTPEEAAPVEGTYAAAFVGPDGEETASLTLRIFRTDDNVLHADMEGVVNEEDPDTAEWLNELDLWLLPREGVEGWFMPGEAYDGVFTESWAGIFFEFEPGDGPSPSFVVWNEFDAVMMRGTRVK